MEKDRARREVVKRNHDSYLSSSGEEEEDQSDGESEAEDEDEDDDDEDDDKAANTDRHRNSVSATAASSLKRLRPRFATCENCAEEFDVETNNKRSCRWHPGSVPASLCLRTVTDTW